MTEQEAGSFAGDPSRRVRTPGFRFVPGDEILHADASRAAATESAVLIMGEQGTGRSTLARFIHDHSRRAAGAFVEFDCAGVPEVELPARVFVDAMRDAEGGTLLVSSFERGAGALRAPLLSWLDSAGRRSAAGPSSPARDVRLLLAVEQDIRTHVDRSLWQRLVAWPPILLTPLRVQRRKKWNLFCLFSECAAAEAGIDLPATADFLLYTHVVSYGWPGNARQLRDFARHLVGIGALKERFLNLDFEFSFFDESEAFAPDDVLEAARAAGGEAAVFRNRCQRDFTRVLVALQSSDSGRLWRELSKASPQGDGRWSYPAIGWTDPHFAGADLCAAVGQAFDAALTRLGSRHERIPARELVYRPDQLPWLAGGMPRRVAPGLSRWSLADLVAYAMVTGEFSGKQDLLSQVYDAIVRIAPDLSAREYQRLGVPRARRAARSPRRRT